MPERRWLAHLQDVDNNQTETTRSFWASRWLDGLNGELLDVGCGTGWFSKYVPAGTRYRGVDPDAEVVSDCRRRGLDVQRATAMALPFPDCSFDSIMLSNVIEHLHPSECLAALAEAHRVLRPSGIIRIITPSAHSRKFWDEPTHVHPFTKISLDRSLRAAGFAQVSVRYEKFWPLIGGLLVDRLRLPGFYNILRKVSPVKETLVATATK